MKELGSIMIFSQHPGAHFPWILKSDPTIFQGNDRMFCPSLRACVFTILTLRLKEIHSEWINFRYFPRTQFIIFWHFKCLSMQYIWKSLKRAPLKWFYTLGMRELCKTQSQGDILSPLDTANSDFPGVSSSAKLKCTYINFIKYAIVTKNSIRIL